jgi:hypothetical protein
MTAENQHMTCPTCAQRVRVHSGEEGTNSYIGVDAEEVQRLEAKLNDVLGNYSTFYAIKALTTERDEALERLRIAQGRIEQLEMGRGLA